MVDHDEINESFLVEYSKFLDQLLKLFSKSEMLPELNHCKELKEESDSEKIARGLCFYNSLEEADLFDSFCNKKITIFSSKNEDTNKISNSLLGEELPLKKLINKQSERTKDVVWNFLHTFYTLFEMSENNREDRVLSSKKNISNYEDNTKSLLEEKSRTPDISKKIIDMDLNDSTSSMINDIIGSFESNLKNSNTSENPFSNILEITNQIADKYTDKIDSGEIELDKLLDSMKEKLPGINNLVSELGLSTDSLKSKPKEEKEITIIDENFSTDSVQLGVEGGDSKKSSLMSGLGMINKLQNDPSIKKMLSMVNNMDGGSEGLLDILKSGDGTDGVMNMLKGTEGSEGLLDVLRNVEGINEFINDETIEGLINSGDSQQSNEETVNSNDATEHNEPDTNSNID